MTLQHPGATCNSLQSSTSSHLTSASSLQGSSRPHDCGLLPAAVQQAFQLLPCVPARSFQLSVSVAEVYNERVSDLLAGGRAAAVRQHPRHGFYAQGLSKQACSSAEEALAVLQAALSHRCAPVLS